MLQSKFYCKVCSCGFMTLESYVTHFDCHDECIFCGEQFVGENYDIEEGEVITVDGFDACEGCREKERRRRAVARGVPESFVMSVEEPESESDDESEDFEEMSWEEEESASSSEGISIDEEEEEEEEEEDECYYYEEVEDEEEDGECIYFVEEPSDSDDAMNQNLNSFRKGHQPSPSITVRRQEMKLQKQGEGTRVRPPFRSPDPRAKGAASSNRSVVIGTGGVHEGDDVTTEKWQKWEPPTISKERGSDSGTNNVSSSTAPGVKTGGSIITKSAAEMALSAMNYSPAQLSSTTATKTVPPLLRVVPAPGGHQGSNGNGKRPVPGSKVTSTSQRVAPGSGRGSSISAVPDIMQSLGKIRSMNQISTNSRPIASVSPTQKLISIPSKKSSGTGVASPAVPLAPKMQPQLQKQVQQPFRVNKPPQVSKSKSKIVPRNAFNNALPKPGAKIGQASSSSSRLSEPATDSSDQQDEEEEDDDPMEEQEVDAPPVKVSAPPLPKSKSTVGGGKAPPAKSLSNNRFNPIESPKKVKGKATAALPPPPPVVTTAPPKVSPKGKTKAVGSTTNGANNKSASSSAAIVAKKSVPPPAAKNPKKKKGSEDTFKKLKSYIPSMPGTDYEMPKLSAIGNYTNRAGQQVWVCLVCNQKEQDESSQDMICCEMCEDWYHWECVGIRQAMEEEDPWYCKRCIYQTCSNPKKDFPKIFKNDVLDF